MNKRDAIMDMGYENSICINGYDDAIIGVSDEGSIIYDYGEMIMLLVEEGMTREEATKWIDCNTIRAIPYAPGPKPIVMYAIDTVPLCDTVRVVRCRDCIMFDCNGDDEEEGWCVALDTIINPNDFCSRGERRTDEAD